MRNRVFSAFLTGIVLFAGTAIAVERHVPSEYSTIQTAINACNNGDVVIIAPGTYTGAGNKNLDFTGKAITIRSTQPTDPCVVAATIIDCESSGRGFYFSSGEDGNSVVDGLIITHGYVANGGGIVCASSSPLIRNCVITANQSQNGDNAQYGGDGYHGGGIYCDNSSAIFENCSITSNAAGNGGDGYSWYDPPMYIPGRGGAGGHGGGLFLQNSSIMLIKCDVVNNNAGRGGHYQDNWWVGGHAGNGGNGGGIYGSGASATLINCNIVYNGAGNGGDYYPIGDGTGGNGGWGGGVYWSGTGLEVFDSRIRSNGAGSAGQIDPGSGFGSGGGIGCMGGSFAITNCEITNNGTIMNGSGIYCSSSTVAISNCTVSGNGPGFMGSGSGIFVQSGTVSVINSIIWGNEAMSAPEISGVDDVTYSDVKGGWTGTGNIDADPCFVAGPQGSYYLSQISAGQVTNSPCVDAGSDTAANLELCAYTTRTDGVIDIDIVDMGYHYDSLGDGDLDRDAFVNFFDYSILADNWLTSPELCDPNGSDIFKDGWVDLSDVAQLVSNWLKCFVTKATNPVPVDYAIDVNTNAILQWSPGGKSTSHDVYFGTDFNEINTADIENLAVYMGNQDAYLWDTNEYDSNGLDTDTTYYWRIDEVAGCIAKGDVWRFTVGEGKAKNPQPSDGQQIITTPPIILSWSAATSIVSYDIYFGTIYNDVNIAGHGSSEYMGNQIADFWDTNNYAPEGLNYNTTYYWRIDEVTQIGTIKGDVWQFTFLEPDIMFGLAVWWKLNEGAGGTVYDSSGNGHNGSIYQASWFNDPARSWCLNFPTENYPRYVYFGRDILNIIGDITISVWVNFSSGSGDIQGIVSKAPADGASNTPFDLRREGTSLVFARADASGSESSSSTVAIAEGQWHHVLVRVENKVPDFYIDGNVTGKTLESFTKTPTGDTTNPLMVGDRGFDWSFKGKLQDIRIYNRALIAEEIWQIYQDGIARKAYNPNPTDSQTSVSPSAVLSWSPSEGALTHDVYFGTNYNDVNVAEHGSGEYMGNQTTNVWDTNNYAPAGLDFNTTYYWRIDEVAAGFTTKGNVWSFTTNSGKAVSPIPPNGATGIDSNAILNWSASWDLSSHDVYFGTSFNDVNVAIHSSSEYMGNQSSATWSSNNFDSNGLEYLTTYYWRIDEVTVNRTVKGDIWSFTTCAEPNIVYGLMAWWRLDETMGSTVHDSAGTNNGEVYGATWTTGRLDGALSFDGTNDYVWCGWGASNYDNITVSAWMKTSVFGTLLSNRYGSYGYGTWYTLFSNVIEIGDNSQGGYRNITFNTPTLDGAWHHIVYTKDGTNHTIYIDGSLDQSFISNADISQDEMMFIGRKWATSSGENWFNGIIDDVRIYNRALSMDEVELLYRSNEAKKAYDPNPTNGKTGVSQHMIFSWSPGIDAVMT